VFVGEIIGVEDDMAVLAEVGETVIGIGITGEGAFVEAEFEVEAAAEVPASPSSSSVPLGSSGTPAVGVGTGEVDPPKVHPSPSGMDGP
jgi:hypothetical protein